MKSRKQLFYEDIFRKLQEKNVRYLVIGGIAVNLYGVQRATGDIDLLLAMDQENLSRFIDLTKELKLVPKSPVKAEDLKDPVKLKEWRKTKNMLVFSFVDLDNPYIVIDVMNQADIDFENMYQRKKEMKAWGISVSTISLDDLIKTKQKSGREQDLADIAALRKYHD